MALFPFEKNGMDMSDDWEIEMCFETCIDGWINFPVDKSKIEAKTPSKVRRENATEKPFDSFFNEARSKNFNSKLG